jgi:hypothetical protein
MKPGKQRPGEAEPLNQIKIQIRHVDAAIAEKVAQDEALSNNLPS